ncbi:hypothetical protein MPL3356_10024 [Mesorhizobium plurifarium]|uniref:Uncharacterized protein n=1 Tax=Mesorhizobium plurifarium TaxID=69974 RepID=A0A090D952_MESPL|nr:hypothetical protein MPL3356_10024 [Mesorhizobium plurifarium]
MFNNILTGALLGAWMGWGNGCARFLRLAPKADFIRQRLASEHSGVQVVSYRTVGCRVVPQRDPTMTFARSARATRLAQSPFRGRLKASEWRAAFGGSASFR